MKGTGVQKQRKSALETTCSAKYVSDIAFSNQEDHNDWVTRLTNSVQMPPYVRGLLRGGLLALTRENVRIFSDVPGVFSPTAYLYDFGGSDMPTADALAIAVTGWHGECADLNAVNVRTRLRATLAAESSNHPVWVFLDTTPSNAEAFQRTHMRLTAAFPDHYGTEACAQLPLSVYVRNGVSFTVAVQKVGDAIFTCPGLHHTVLTPMGCAKLAVNCATSKTIRHLETWADRWQFDNWYTSEATKVSCLFGHMDFAYLMHVWSQAKLKTIALSPTELRNRAESIRLGSNDADQMVNLFGSEYADIIDS